MLVGHGRASLLRRIVRRSASRVGAYFETYRHGTSGLLRSRLEAPVVLDRRTHRDDATHLFDLCEDGLAVGVNGERFGNDGFVWGVLLDGNGGGTQLIRNENDDWPSQAAAIVDHDRVLLYKQDERATHTEHAIQSVAEEAAWVHLDFENKNTRQWLDQRYRGSSLNQHFTAPESSLSPRFQEGMGGAVVTMGIRGVHQPAGDQQMEDMVALRMKLTPRVLITAGPDRKRRFIGLPDEYLNLVRGNGARTTGALFASIIHAAVVRCSPAISQLASAELQMQERLQKLLLESLRRQNRWRLSNLAIPAGRELLELRYCANIYKRGIVCVVCLRDL